MRGDRIRKLREDKNKTQADVAKYVGVNPSQIGRWERGEIMPSSEALGKMAAYFGVTADYLLGLVDVPQADLKASDLSPDEQELIQYLRRGMLANVLALLAAITNRNNSD